MFLTLMERGKIMKNIVLIGAILLGAVACSKGGDERIGEQENIKVRKQIEALNDNQRNWALTMEKGLNERKYFIKAVEGAFLGEVSVNGVDFLIKAEMLASIPIVISDRSRTLDEINFELQNLTLTIHVKMENPRVLSSAVSCTIENHRPNIREGVIKIISNSCKNIFKLMLSDTLEQTDLLDRSTRSAQLARSVMSNEITQIDILNGLFESSASTEIYPFTLKRN